MHSKFLVFSALFIGMSGLRTRGLRAKTLPVVGLVKLGDLISQDREVVMLEHFINGKRQVCRPIGDKGRVGRVVILDPDRVAFGNKPDLKKYPLALCVQPCTFTIVEKVKGENGYYVVTNAKGRRLTLKHEHFGANESFLYDANEWLAWQREHFKDRLAKGEREIEKLKAQVDLLTGILTSQGIRIVAKEVAEKLGIT